MYPREGSLSNRQDGRVQGDSQMDAARRKLATTMLSLSLCGVLSFVLSGLATGILRFGLPSSDYRAKILLPPWLIKSEFSLGFEEKKMLILQSAKDRYLFNGVPPPDDDTDGLAWVTNIRNTEILHCVTCAPVDGKRWIAAVSWDSGAGYSGLVKQSAYTNVSVSSERWTRAERWSNIDLGLPVGCQDGVMLRYSCKVLYEVVRKISLNMSVRILITRYSCGNTKEKPATLQELETLSGMMKRRERRAVYIRDHAQSVKSADELVFLPVEGVTFSQEQAVASIHANTDHANPRSLLIVFGVNMFVKLSFIHNCMAFVSPGVSAYFPIVWSAFNPRSIRLSYVLRSVHETGHFDKDQGVWLTAGFGVYAMASLDAVNISMKVNSGYTGWGSEGRDFLTESVSKSLHIVRKLERGTTRMFFQNGCEKNAFNLTRHCIRSVSYFESSPLAMYVKLQPDRFPRGYLPKNPFSKILVAITTSRNTFWQRVGLVESAWASKEQLPGNVIVKYFFGHLRSLNHTRDIDIKADLARGAQLPGMFLADEAIAILHDVDDDEYPPVLKKIAMLKAIEELPMDIRWIMVVDDDTHVHLAGLQRLVLKYDEQAPVMLGSASCSQKHDVMNWEFIGSASCLNGPAFAMSYVMLKLVNKQNACIRAGDALRPSGLSSSFWHSKVVTSCVERSVLGPGGCQKDSPGFQLSQLFREYSKESGVIADRKLIVSTHKDNMTQVLHPIAEADWRDLLR